MEAQKLREMQREEARRVMELKKKISQMKPEEVQQIDFRSLDIDIFKPQVHEPLDEIDL